MTQETAWLDYTKPPPGYAAMRHSWHLSTDGTHTGAGASCQTWTQDETLSDAWGHYKASDDPHGLPVPAWLASSTAGAEARAAAWAWHDRRRAIVLDIDDQTCSGGKHLAAWMALALAWTDAECAEVEAYAALTFPRSVDMPAPLQRVLLPEGPA